MIDNSIWWNDSYLFRRVITIDPVSGIIPQDHSIEVVVPKAKTLDMGKIRNDLGDVVVAIYSIGEWTVLPIEVVDSDTEILVRFAPGSDIDTLDQESYFLYYGNSTLVNAPNPDDFEFEYWSIQLDSQDVGISYTRPDEHWITGVSDTKYAVATLTADAAAMRWRTTFSLDSAIAEVSIDDSEWVDVNLYSTSTLIDQVGYTVLDLKPSNDASPKTYHKLQVRVSDRNDARSVGGKVTVTGFDWRKYMVVQLLNEDVQALSWQSIVVG